MSVLAFDPGIRAGWAHSSGASGVFSVADMGDHGQALALFSDWVEALMDRHAPLIYIACERGYGGNQASGRLTTAMELTIHAHAWARNIPRTDRGASEVRSWLLGYARVPASVEPVKARRVRMLDAAVLEAVQARGFFPAAGSEHAADAAALLCCCEQRPVRQVAPTPDLDAAFQRTRDMFEPEGRL